MNVNGAIETTSPAAITSSLHGSLAEFGSSLKAYKKHPLPRSAAAGPALLPMSKTFCHWRARCDALVTGLGLEGAVADLLFSELAGAGKPDDTGGSSRVGTAMYERTRFPPTNAPQNARPRALATLNLVELIVPCRTPSSRVDQSTEALGMVGWTQCQSIHTDLWDQSRSQERQCDLTVLFGSVLEFYLR